MTKDNAEDDQDIAESIRWSGPIAILAVHAMALGLLYLLIVFVGHSFVDHYAAIGVGSTPRFDAVKSVADFFAKYSMAVVAVVIVDAVIIRRLARMPARCLSAYSHTYLAAIVFVMFISFTWMINPMVWNAPNLAVPAANQAVASLP
ncbi:MAG: hypothetical protein IT422_18850 [Pirellulaceae bacterium]|nr:hypothetical protein [Pirellulaceae bacterium]